MISVKAAVIAATNRPGGISGEGGQAISSPRYLSVWHGERERDEGTICGAGVLIQEHGVS